MAITVAMVVVPVEKALFPPVEEGGIGLQVEVRQPWIFELAVMQRLFLIVVLLPSDNRRSAGRHYTQIARHSVPSCRVTSRLCMRVISRRSWQDQMHCSILGDAGGGAKKVCKRLAESSETSSRARIAVLLKKCLGSWQHIFEVRCTALPTTSCSRDIDRFASQKMLSREGEKKDRRGQERRAGRRVLMHAAEQQRGRNTAMYQPWPT